MVSIRRGRMENAAALEPQPDLTDSLTTKLPFEAIQQRCDLD